MEVLLPRTLLFVPGNREDMIEKARGLPADALILDLEDSVPWDEKGRAREIVSRNISPDFPLAGQLLFVRINHPHKGLLDEELRAVAKEGHFGIHVPKVESPEEIKLIEEKLFPLERERGLSPIKLIPWVESPRSVAMTYDIARSSERIVGMAFGTDDYLCSIGVERSEEGTEVLFPKAFFALMARAAGVMPYDTPYINYRDTEGLKRETLLIKRLGFYGKTIIHPSQIEPVREIFRPSGEAMERARRIVEAYEEAMRKGLGTVSVNGMAIDMPVFERAKKILESGK